MLRFLNDTRTPSPLQRHPFALRRRANYLKEDNMSKPSSSTTRAPFAIPSSGTLPTMADMAKLNPALQAWGQFGEYMTDAAQRTILFWDVMRQRSTQYYAQKDKAVPHVLSFDAELVLDARTFDKPVNYLLVRIKPAPGVVVDPVKRPFVVVDPRAGHGPGIGGFKADSEIGVAMRAGHPCYFVGFTPEPMPGQTIEDIMDAEAVFLERVIALHPEAEGKPCVIGNCQGGWSVMLVAGDPARAVRPDHRRRVAPVVLGRRGRREPHALHRRPGRRQLDDGADQRPGQRQVRRRPPGRRISRT